MIHCYQFDGLNIVLDCYSGSIHMVDKVAYDMIRWYETEPADPLETRPDSPGESGMQPPDPCRP